MSAGKLKVNIETELQLLERDLKVISHDLERTYQATERDLRRISQLNRKLETFNEMKRPNQDNSEAYYQSIDNSITNIALQLNDIQNHARDNTLVLQVTKKALDIVKRRTSHLNKQALDKTELDPQEIKAILKDMRKLVDNLNDGIMPTQSHTEKSKQKAGAAFGTAVAKQALFETHKRSRGMTKPQDMQLPKGEFTSTHKRPKH